MISSKWMNSKILNKSQGSEYLLMRVYLPSSEDLTSHLMENYFYYLLEYGIKVLKVDLNTVASSIEKTIFRNHLSSCQLMENQL